MTLLSEGAYDALVEALNNLSEVLNIKEVVMCNQLSPTETYILIEIAEKRYDKMTDYQLFKFIVLINSLFTPRCFNPVPSFLGKLQTLINVCNSIDRETEKSLKSR